MAAIAAPDSISEVELFQQPGPSDSNSVDIQ